MADRLRLDQKLVDLSLAPSRSRARDMIARGCVQVDGVVARKAGQAVSNEARIAADDPAHGYVSRAALKLVHGLDHMDWDVTGCRALDLGSSTGGFTQVLLQRGATHVTAVDVGHGQMVDLLANDDRVHLQEGLNARNLAAGDLTGLVDLVVSDMSFVSLTLAATPALLLAAPNARAVLLVKPQFEVGRDGIGKGGVVRDSALIEPMLEEIRNWFTGLEGWQIIDLIPSPIAGGDGNSEYLLCGARHG